MKYCCLIFCIAAANAQLIVPLRPETVREFDAYQADADREIQQRWRGGGRAFLWIDEQPDKKREAGQGRVITEALTGADGRSVANGLIHDWVGDIYLRGVKLETVRDFLLDTERHPAVYHDVKRAKVLSREAYRSATLLRFVKKKYMTVVLDVEYKNDWSQPGPDRWTMSARSSKVSEIRDAGTPDESALPAGTGHGFLWRMNSFWSLRQDAGGTWVELRSLTLSRDTPRGLGWMIRPLIRNFPAEAILATLEATQGALR